MKYKDTKNIQLPQEPAWESDPELSYIPPPDNPQVTDEPAWQATDPTQADEPQSPADPLQELLNTPTSFVIIPDDSSGTATALPVVDANRPLSQLEDIVKPLKPSCAGVVATYVCGSHDAAPQYAGPSIGIAAGDELAMNSLVLKVVSIDGAGNGVGTIKVPMLNGARLALKLSGIQAAKGGCIVAGRAEIDPSVPLLQLDDKLRQNLQTLSLANQLVANAGQQYAGAIAETINNLLEFIAKAKAFAKGYKGGSQQAAQAKAYEAYAQRVQAALLANANLAAADKQQLQAAITAAQPAWDFYKTGKPCTTSGNGGGGEALFRLPLADCGTYTQAIDTQMGILEKVNNSFTCNCSPILSDCSPISNLLSTIRQANLDKKQEVTITKVDNRSSLSNSTDWVSALNGIDIDGKCFKILMEFKFESQSVTLDPNHYNETTNGFELVDAKGKVLLSINLLDETGRMKQFKIATLKKHLGFEETNSNSRRENKNKKLLIKYSSGVDESVINIEIENWLYEIFDNAEINRIIIVTSTKRSAERQANAMITNINSQGVKAMKELYGSKGDRIIEYYIEIKDKHTESEIITLMVQKMIALSFVSSHMDWINKGAIDFGENSNGFNGTYEAEVSPIVSSAKKHKRVNSNQVFAPTAKGEKALHIEINL